MSQQPSVKHHRRIMCTICKAKNSNNCARIDAKKQWLLFAGAWYVCILWLFVTVVPLNSIEMLTPVCTHKTDNHNIILCSNKTFHIVIVFFHQSFHNYWYSLQCRWYDSFIVLYAWFLAISLHRFHFFIETICWYNIVIKTNIYNIAMQCIISITIKIKCLD